MNEELYAFIENAIEKQNQPYVLSSTENGLVLELAPDKLVDEVIPEKFKLTVTLDEKNGKPVFYLKEQVFKLLHSSENGYTVGDEFELDRAVGSEEVEDKLVEENWKLFVARRWLVSLIEFKGYKLRQPAKTRSRAAVITLAAITAFVVLAALFGGIAQSMGGGIFQSKQDVKVKTEKGESDKILGDFYK